MLYIHFDQFLFGLLVPDPLFQNTDPQILIRIQIKMKLIHDTFGRGTLR